LEDPGDYVFYARPSEVWGVEFTNLAGDRVVEVLGTEHAARQAFEQYRIDGAVLLRSPTDFHSVSTSKQPDRGRPRHIP
jgi:hypothetical protein